jgi:hypothetical protein
MKKTIIACAILIGTTLVLSATYVATFTDAVITGEGSVTANIGETGFGTNQNAALQVSRNLSDAGQGQGAAIDVYAGSNPNGALQRWWVDNINVTAGKSVATIIDGNGALRTSAYMLISGIVANGGTAATYLPLEPTSDSNMFAIATDIASGAAMYVSVCPSSICAPSSSAAQAFVAMDGTSGQYNANVRFAIGGQDGEMRWTNSTSNTFAGATWDTQIGRVSAGILGDGTTQLQTIHLDQPTSKKDLAGTIAIVAATSGTFTFSTAYGAAPICVASPISNPPVAWWVTSTATAVKVNLAAATTITFNYHCVGNPN